MLLAQCGGRSSDRRMLRNLVWCAVIGTLCGITSLSVQAKDFNVMSLAWLSSAGNYLSSEAVRNSFGLIPIAINHFNDRDTSILPVLGTLGRCTSRLRLLDGIFDDQGLASVAMSRVVRVMGNDTTVDFIHGMANSDVAQSVGITGGALGLSLMSHVSTISSLNDKSTYPTFFRVVPSDAQYTEVLVELLVSLNIKTIGLIYSSDPFGNSFRSTLRESSETRGIQVISSSLYDPTLPDEELILQLVRSMRIMKANRLNIIVRTTLNARQEFAFAKAAFEANFSKGRLHIGRLSSTIVLDDIASREEREYLRDFFKGSISVVSGFNQSNPGYLNLQHAMPKMNVTYVNSFMPNHTTFLGESFYFRDDFFTNPGPNRGYDAAAYDSVIAMGLATCGPSNDLNENLRRLKFDGTMGTVSFNKYQNLDSSHVTFRLANVIETTNDKGENILQSVHAGHMVNGSWVFTQPLIFSDGTSTRPPDIDLPVKRDSLHIAARVVGWIEATVACCAGLWALSRAFLAAFPMHGEPRRGFSPDQALHLGVLACGVILLGLSIIPLTLENDLGCSLFPWFFVIGFTLTLSGLTAKALYTKPISSLQPPSAPPCLSSKSCIPSRVTRALTDGSPDVSHAPIRRFHRQISPCDWSVLKSFCLVFVLTLTAVGIMLAWQLVAPLTFAWVITEEDASNYPTSVAAACVEPSQTTSAFFISVVCFIAVFAFFTFAISIARRNDPGKGQDAKMTAVAGLSIFQVFFVGIPTAAAVWRTSLARFLVLSSVTFMICMIIIFTIYVPRMCQWRSNTWNLFPSKFSTMEAPRVDQPSNRARANGSSRTSRHKSGRGDQGQKQKSATVQHIPSPEALGAPDSSNTQIESKSSSRNSRADPQISVLPDDFKNIGAYQRTLPGFVDLGTLSGLSQAGVTHQPFMGTHEEEVCHTPSRSEMSSNTSPSQIRRRNDVHGGEIVSSVWTGLELKAALGSPSQHKDHNEMSFLDPNNSLPLSYGILPADLYKVNSSGEIEQPSSTHDGVHLVDSSGSPGGASARSKSLTPPDSESSFQLMNT